MSLRIISGLFKGRSLQTPKGPSTRPTQGMLRESVFNICQNEIPKARFLDPFAGSGAMGFEALSRGAAHITLGEPNRMALSCIKANIDTLQVKDQTTLIPQPAEKTLTRLVNESARFDIIYLDPPYDLKIETLFPLATQLLDKDGILFLEERYDRKKRDTPLCFPDLELKNTRRFGVALLSTFIVV